MASLSTCRLGLWLGWQILLNLVKSVFSCEGTPRLLGYCLQLCKSIQMSSDIGNIWFMYDGIKKATGLSIKKTAPLKTKTGEVVTLLK